jgi:archaellum biogenesis ATPase FlaH
MSDEDRIRSAVGYNIMIDNLSAVPLHDPRNEVDVEDMVRQVSDMCEIDEAVVLGYVPKIIDEMTIIRNHFVHGQKG